MKHTHRSWHLLAALSLGGMALTIALAQPPAPPAAPTAPAAVPATAAKPWASPATRSDGGWAARNDSFNARAKQGREKGDIDIVFLGDSITQGWEGAGKAVWEKAYAPRRAVNMGIGGDRTQHVIGRIDSGNLDGLDKPLAGKAPRLAVIMIGTNNTGSDTAEQIAEGVGGVVQSVRAKLPEAKVLLLAVFPRGEKPSDGPRVKIADLNQRIEKLADGKQVVWMDLGPAFLGASVKAKPAGAETVSDVPFGDVVAWVKAAGKEVTISGPVAKKLGLSDGAAVTARQIDALTGNSNAAMWVCTAGGKTVAVMLDRQDGKTGCLMVATDAGAIERVATGDIATDGDGANITIAAKTEFAAAFERAKIVWAVRCESLMLSKEIMPDFLHLSAKGYQVWADAMEAKVKDMLGEK